MKRIALILCVAFIGSGFASAESASDIIKTAQVKGGLVVHPGCGDGLAQGVFSPTMNSTTISFIKLPSSIASKST